jgi:hypothetical protein
MMKRVFVLLLLCGMARGQADKSHYLAERLCIRNYPNADCNCERKADHFLCTVHDLTVNSGAAFKVEYPISLVNDLAAWPPETAEPEDVPAIKHVSVATWDIAKDGELLGFSQRCALLSGEMDSNPVSCKQTRWTCADKLRVLEHDESEPPHYYCRKPQTESK